MSNYELLTDPDTGEVVTITPLQGAAVWRAMEIWREVCSEADSNWIREPEYTSNWINAMKSRLLGRMLYDGKPPHPTAPPNSYAGGWWEVVEDGIAFLYEHAYGGPYSDGDGTQHMGICGDRWIYIRTELDGSQIVGHHRLPGEEWRLSKCTEQSERTIVGQSGVLDFGNRKPIYASAVLCRIFPRPAIVDTNDANSLCPDSDSPDDLSGSPNDNPLSSP
jgi:hypothetical protein